VTNEIENKLTILFLKMGKIFKENNEIVPVTGSLERRKLEIKISSESNIQNEEKKDDDLIEKNN
jgi:hypothetical protein